MVFSIAFNAMIDYTQNVSALLEFPPCVTHGPPFVIAQLQSVTQTKIREERSRFRFAK